MDEHSLKLSLAQKSSSIEAYEQDTKTQKLLGKKRKAVTEMEDVKNEEAKSNKLMVRNLAFESTPEDVKELFKQYGTIRKVRLPKKVNSENHRGFGFVEFATSEEAMQAFSSL